MGWRTKLVSLLLVYSAGFATAVYCLAPAAEQEAGPPLEVVKVQTALQSQAFAQSVNSGMHKCIDLGREAAFEMAGLIREKINEAKSRPDG